MSRSTVVTVSTTETTFSYNTGSRELAEIFGVWQLNLDTKFKGEFECVVAKESLLKFLRMYPRNKHIQFMLDLIEDAFETWKLICSTSTYYPLPVTITVRCED